MFGDECNGWTATQGSAHRLRRAWEKKGLRVGRNLDNWDALERLLYFERRKLDAFKLKKKEEREARKALGSDAKKDSADPDRPPSGKEEPVDLCLRWSALEKNKFPLPGVVSDLQSRFGGVVSGHETPSESEASDWIDSEEDSEAWGDTSDEEDDADDEEGDDGDGEEEGKEEGGPAKRSRVDSAEGGALESASAHPAATEATTLRVAILATGKDDEDDARAASPVEVHLEPGFVCTQTFARDWAYRAWRAARAPATEDLDDEEVAASFAPRGFRVHASTGEGAPEETTQASGGGKVGEEPHAGDDASAPKDAAPSLRGPMVAVDCEMVRTDAGLELARVSLVGADRRLLLDMLVVREPDWCWATLSLHSFGIRNETVELSALVSSSLNFSLLLSLSGRATSCALPFSGVPPPRAPPLLPSPSSLPLREDSVRDARCATT